MTTTRRGLISGALGAGALAVTGCAGGGAATSVNTRPVLARADGPVRLTYWCWLRGMQAVCDLWNRDHPAVRVDAVWSGVGNAGGYSRMFAALRAGGGADIAQVQYQMVPSFLLENGLVDLDRYGFAQHADRYRPADLSRVSLAGGTFAVPTDTGPLGFFYRRDLLDALGAVPPRTWPEWADLSRAVKEADPTARLEGFNVNDPGTFTSFCMQAGARWFSTAGDSWYVDVAGEQTRQVARFMDTVLGEGLIDTDLAPFSPGWFAAAADGSLAAVTTGSWGDALLEGVGGTAGSWRVAPPPVWPEGGYASATFGGSTAAVLANSPHPAEALDFLVWLTTDPEAVDAQIRECGIGWSPTPDYLGADREGPSEFFGGQDYNREVFLPSSQAQNPDWIWSPVYLEFNDALSGAFRERAGGGRPLVEALPGLQELAVDVMRRKGLDVQEGVAP